MIEKLYGDSGKRSGPRIFQHLKKRKVEYDLSFAKDPRPSGHRWLTGRGKNRDRLPQTLWRRAFLSPCHLDEEAAQHRREENMPESVHHRTGSLLSRSDPADHAGHSSMGVT
jgi:hypothetical protein